MGEGALSPSFSGRITLSATSHLPTARITSSRVIPPGRKMTGVSPVTDSTVDSTPTLQSPPSRISGIRPSISSSICAARVGLGRPDRLPLGAAMGTPDAAISPSAAGCIGQRTATVSSPAVVTSGTAGFFFISRVSGPGQKAFISSRASPVG